MQMNARKVDSDYMVVSRVYIGQLCLPVLGDFKENELNTLV